MYRWTIEKLKETGDRDFAICILNERLNRLSNPYSPFANKLRDTIANMEEEQETIRQLADFILDNWHSCPIPIALKCKCGFNGEGCRECLIKNTHLLSKYKK